MNEEIKKDFDFSDPNFFKASTEEDQKFGIDFWIFNIPVAYRKRRINCPSDITIRYRRLSGAKTEYNKILEEIFKALLFLFEFEDKIIFTDLKSIRNALLNKQFYVITNKDKKTELCIIKLKDIKYLEIIKG